MSGKKGREYGPVSVGTIETIGRTRSTRKNDVSCSSWDIKLMSLPIDEFEAELDPTDVSDFDDADTLTEYDELLYDDENGKCKAQSTSQCQQQQHQSIVPLLSQGMSCHDRLKSFESHFAKYTTIRDFE